MCPRGLLRALCWPYLVCLCSWTHNPRFGPTSTNQRGTINFSQSASSKCSPSRPCWWQWAMQLCLDVLAWCMHLLLHEPFSLTWRTLSPLPQRPTVIVELVEVATSWNLHGWTSMGRVNQMGVCNLCFCNYFSFGWIRELGFGLVYFKLQVWSILLRTEPKFTSLQGIHFHNFDWLKLMLLNFSIRLAINESCLIYHQINFNASEHPQSYAQKSKKVFLKSWF